MTPTTDTDAWCDLVEAALIEDHEAAWAAAAADAGPLAPPGDPEEAARQAERVAALLERLQRRHAETHAELDDLSEERRQLLVHARAVRTYASAESAGTIDQLLRMMWVG